jgi:hypothetical protein
LAKLLRVLGTGLLAVAAGWFPASAEGLGYAGWGPRAGVSIDPDQVFGGIHIDFGEIARNVRFQPSAELGFGDDVTLLSLNLEAAYLFKVYESWMPYAGGGLDFIYAKLDDAPRGVDDDDTDLGLVGLGGVQRVRSGGYDFFLELKIGLTSDTPDARALFGWTFGKPTRHRAAAGTRK